MENTCKQRSHDKVREIHCCCFHLYISCVLVFFLVFRRFTHVHLLTRLATSHALYVYKASKYLPSYIWHQYELPSLKLFFCMVEWIASLWLRKDFLGFLFVMFSTVFVHFISFSMCTSISDRKWPSHTGAYMSMSPDDYQ